MLDQVRVGAAKDRFNKNAQNLRKYHKYITKFLDKTNLKMLETCQHVCKDCCCINVKSRFHAIKAFKYCKTDLPLYERMDT